MKRDRNQRSANAKLFVLDTNVLMHDPSSLFRFEEHDLYIPMVTLEELDNGKKGTTDAARNARAASRFIDAILSRSGADIAQGVPLAGGLHALGGEGAGASERAGPAAPTGRLYLQGVDLEPDLPESLVWDKADNQILAVVATLADEQEGEREVVLVSKDINVRIKARALGLAAEDYFNDKVIEDSDVLYSGQVRFESDFWERLADLESGKRDGHAFYRFRGPLAAGLLPNQLVAVAGERPLHAIVREAGSAGVLIEAIRDYTHEKNAVYGVTARNPEQSFALNLLMDPAIDFVTLLGQAGSGKTLLAVAAGLAQVLDANRYSEIIMTRVTVPLGEDIGFLPGTEEEKMTPWMGALDDTLDFLHASEEAGEWGKAATRDILRSRVKVKSLNFMRGRTFLKKFLILDEAQNLSAKQMKTLVTRAGPGTKVVCLGNIAQIDTPYLTEGSSGLTYVVDRFRGWAHYGHITLQRGERSRLADRAAEVL